MTPPIEQRIVAALQNPKGHDKFITINDAIWDDWLNWKPLIVERGSKQIIFDI